MSTRLGMVAVVALLSSQASAEQAPNAPNARLPVVKVPISAAYGTKETCEFRSVANPVIGDDVGYLLRPDGLFGLETRCRPTGAAGQTVTFNCAVDDPEPMPLKMTITEDVIRGVVIAQTDEWGDITLDRCP